MKHTGALSVLVFSLAVIPVAVDAQVPGLEETRVLAEP